MKTEITHQGRIVIEGLVFDWTRDNAEMLEVWHWQYGRKYERMTGETCEGVAREMALQLIADRQAAGSSLHASAERASPA
jgi:hypothetical protein